MEKFEELSTRGKKLQSTLSNFLKHAENYYDCWKEVVSRETAAMYAANSPFVNADGDFAYRSVKNFMTHEEICKPVLNYIEGNHIGDELWATMERLASSVKSKEELKRILLWFESDVKEKSIRGKDISSKNITPKGIESFVAEKEPFYNSLERLNYDHRRFENYKVHLAAAEPAAKKENVFKKVRSLFTKPNDVPSTTEKMKNTNQILLTLEKDWRKITGYDYPNMIFKNSMMDFSAYTNFCYQEEGMDFCFSGGSILSKPQNILNEGTFTDAQGKWNNPYKKSLSIDEPKIVKLSTGKIPDPKVLREERKVKMNMQSPRGGGMEL